MEGGEDLYDEFGNYIGPDLNAESSDSSEEEHVSQSKSLPWISL